MIDPLSAVMIVIFIIGGVTEKKDLTLVEESDLTEFMPFIQARKIVKAWSPKEELITQSTGKFTVKVLIKITVQMQFFY